MCQYFCACSLLTFIFWNGNIIILWSFSLFRNMLVISNQQVLYWSEPGHPVTAPSMLIVPTCIADRHQQSQCAAAALNPSDGAHHFCPHSRPQYTWWTWKEEGRLPAKVILISMHEAIMETNEPYPETIILYPFPYIWLLNFHKDTKRNIQIHHD